MPSDIRQVVASVAPYVSIFTGYAENAKERALREAMHANLNLMARTRRQIAGLEGKPLIFDREIALRNWAIDYARLALYRLAIKKAGKGGPANV